MEQYPLPTKPPTYVFKETKPKQNPKRIYALLDSAFAGIGLFLTFWFVVVLLVEGLSFSWQSIVFLIAFWLVLTYLALPRMHQIFTTLYLPDYFMARTKTGDGLLGDPVNLALMGSEEDIHSAMRRANWVQADPITLRSSLGIIRSSLTRKSYPAAPVSDLFLFDRRQEFAYQQEVDGNASQRHHVRFWPVPEGWRLPGGERVDWLAAGTYDKSVGFSTMTLQVTHKIDADVDTERDYIIDSVRYHDPECSVRVIEQFSTPFHDRNGGGDSVQTDGNMPVLNVSGADDRAEKAGLGRSHSSNQDLDDTDVLNKEAPPKPFLFVGVFLAVRLLFSVILLLAAPNMSDNGPIVELAASGISVTIIEGILFLLALRRFRWGRLGFLILVTLDAIAQLAMLSSGEAEDFASIIGAGFSVLLVLAFSAPSVREWVFTVRRRGGALPIGQ